MTLPAVVFIALGLSVDAMIASFGSGAARPCWRVALRSGLVFGSMAALLAFAGWALGHEAGRAFAHYDHWIAFILLSIVGWRMIDGRKDGAPAGGAGLLAASAAASIDALAAGASFAFLSAPIIPLMIALALAGFVLSSAGSLAGGAIRRRFGSGFGEYASVGGGLLLIGLGVSILADHLTG